MAAAAALSPGQPPARKGSSLLMQGGALLATTLLAVGMGWFAGGRLAPAETTQASEAAVPSAHAPAGSHGAAPAAGGHGGSAEHGEAEEAAPGFPTIIPLAPINTNLAAPTDVWVRMELSLEFKNAPEPGMADSIHQDILAYARTLKLYQLEGASGIIHLKADLDERAKLRSGNKVSRVLIRTLLFE